MSGFGFFINIMEIDIISPVTKVFSGKVNSITLPGTDGSFQILNNHAPIISTLAKGQMKLMVDASTPSVKGFEQSSDKRTLTREIPGGVVEVNNNKIIVLIDA